MKPQIINRKLVTGNRGLLTIADGDWKRAFWISDVPEGVERGGHAHRTQVQEIYVLGGMATIETDRSEAHTLMAPHQGLRILPLTWVVIRDISPGASILVLTDKPYDEQDYIRDWEEFRRMADTIQPFKG